MQQPPILATVQAAQAAQTTQAATPAEDVAELSLVTESVEQLIAISFRETLQAVADKLDIGDDHGLDQLGFGGIAVSAIQPALSGNRLVTEPTLTVNRSPGGDFMPHQTASTGKPLPLQYTATTSLPTALNIPAELPETNPGVEVETHLAKMERMTIASVLNTTHDGMIQPFDSRDGIELASQVTQTAPQSISSTLPSKTNLLSLPVDTTVGQPGWDKAVGERIQWMIGRNIQNAEVKLTPPNLGPLEIRISVQNDQTSISFIAAQAPTREALEVAIPRLREMFQEANLNLLDVDVGQHQGSDSPQEQSADAKGHIYSNLHETLSPDVTISPPSRLVTNGLLDDYA